MLMELSKIYKGKKIFLTGHTGFKGAWLLKIFSMLKAEVKGYSLAPQNENDLYNLINGNKLCDSVISDLRNKESLENAILSFQPDFIFHLAAQPLVRHSYEFPLDTFEINVNGTANILEFSKKLNKKCSLVLITTDKVYHNNEWIYPYREEDRLGGYDPYSASKACSELVIDSYRSSFFNLHKYNIHEKGIAVARAGNVIGGGDWSKDRLVPDIIAAINNNNKVILRNPNSVRPWQFVLEPLFGYLMLGSKLSEDPFNFSKAYNFGPNSSDVLTVESMVKKAIEIYGTGGFLIEEILNQPHEAGLLKLDISKANDELKWFPKYNSQEAIANTIEWYKQFKLDPNKILSFTEHQINKYLNFDLR
jgi:CDP-glucose 4,6-dehydratase